MADSDVVLEARERGSESMDCPTCGKSLGLVEQPDGGTTYEACSKCYSKPTKKDIREQADLQREGVMPREVGTDVKEQ